MVTVVLLLLVPVLGCSSGSDEGERDPDQPNIVLIVADDLDTASPFWEAMPKSRELIRDRGVTFENSFATNPVCCPARATILTGKYPHNTEVFDSVTGLDNFAERGSKTTIGVRLKRHGYATAFIGKYLNGYELDPSYVPPGWDEWFGLAGRNFLRGYGYQANHNGRMERYGRGSRAYQTDVLKRVALQFIDDTRAGEAKPLLLTLFPSAPHAPIEPARRHSDHPFADAPLPKSANFDEADVTDKPRWLQLYPRVTPEDIETYTQAYRDRLGSLLAIDEMVSAIAGRLRDAGELDRTIFVFTSDNGYTFGSHRVLGKLVPYEESIRVPLAIAGPGISHASSDALVIQPDLAPTLYDLAGLDVPDDVDGMSLTPLLGRGPPSWPRRDFLVEYRANPLIPLHTFAAVEARLRDFPDAPRLVADYRAVRSDRWMYVEWYAAPDHDYELYDMAEDPYQLSNLLADGGDARLESTTTALHRRMEALSSCSGRSCR